MRKIISAALLLLQFLPAALAEKAAPSDQAAFQKGLELRETNRLDEAESQFKRALEENPSNADYHFELANIYAVQHDASMDDKDYERAKQFMESAARELDQAIMIRQDFLAAHFNLGVVYKKLRKYEKARAEFKEVIRIDPNSTQAMMQIGQTYEDQGFLEEAESVYREVRQRAPQSDDADYALEHLDEQRNYAGVVAQRQMNQSLGMNQQKLSNAYAERSDPGLANAYSRQYAPSQGGSTGSALAPLLQQFMQSRSQRNNRDNW